MTDKEIIERICGSCNCDEATAKEYLNDEIRKHSKKCTFYTLRFGCSFAAVNTIKPQLL